MNLNTLYLNIGLNIGTSHNALKPLTALHAIADHLPLSQVKEWHVRIHPLTGEPTLVVRISTRIAGPNTLAPCIHGISLALSQDCISGKLCISGEAIHEFLTGPNTAPYGDAFDPDYWLAVACDNNPQELDTMYANLIGEHRLNGWTMGWNFTAGVWFKRDSDGAGGKVYFTDNEVVDYEGVSSLPLAVVTMLRQAGALVSVDFE